MDSVKMGNDFLEFYGEHKISPVHQDISDIDRHYARRRKLYRQCGIPLQTFKNARVLEVGPGGGYNTLALFAFGAHVDLVEANPTGIQEMKTLFPQYGIASSSYTITQCKIEDYSVDKEYDIVIAEGFLHCLRNQEEIIGILDTLVKAKGGIVVITCADNFGYFIEIMKRVLASFLAKDIKEFHPKVQFLTKIFEGQLKQLSGMSRPASDWVQDVLLNPAIVNGVTLSFADAICKFGDKYCMLGSSPHLFSDYSWYKDGQYNRQEELIAQFREKQFSMLLAGDQEIRVTDMELIEIMESFFRRIKQLAELYDRDNDISWVLEMRKEFDLVDECIEELHNEKFLMIFHEIHKFVVDLSKNTVDIERYPHFLSAFGKGMQYIAFEKN